MADEIGAVKLTKSALIEVVPAKHVQTDTIIVRTITDNRIDKTVKAFIKFNSFPGGDSVDLTLWEGDAYDEIGQWTDAQANERINELLTK